MPNWTSNQLVIEGDETLILSFLESIKGDEGEIIDFEKIIPMPELLKNTGSGYHSFKNESGEDVTLSSWYCRRYKDAEGKDQTEERPFTQAEKLQLAELGATNWYDWACANWGVKWNASDSQITDQFNGYAEIRFTTPWDTCKPILEALREKFPDLEFTLRYRLEDDYEFPHDADGDF